MKFTILKRMTLGYLAILVLVVFMGTYVIFKLNQLNRMIHDISTINVAALGNLEDMLDTLLTQVRFEKKFLISQDPDFYSQFQKNKQNFERLGRRLEPLLDSPDKYDLFLQAKVLYERYIALFEEETGLLRNGAASPKRSSVKEREQITDKIDNLLRETIYRVRKDRDEKISSSNLFSYGVLRIASLTVGLTVVVGLLVSFLTTRSINRSISLLKRKTKEIAAGRFAEIHDVVSPPEIKELAEDFNTMTKRLKELDEMKLAFFSNVSHELRTPLTVIRESSDMLLNKELSDSPEKQQQLLTITKEECDRLIHAVSRILDLSRMDAGMTDYRFNPSNPEPVLQKTVLKLASVAYSKNIDLELKPLPNLPQVNMDEERIEHVLENLIGNAIKYTPENGAVTVRAEVRKDGKRGILFSVSDTGPGIPKEEGENIFDRFRRMDKGGGGVMGTGLGLSIAKQIIIDHGGKIWMESESGKGCTFYFTLPVF